MLFDTNPVVSNGTPEVVEDIVCIYIDLDSLIASCGLTPGEERIVKNLMMGYAMSDIAEHFHVTRQTCSVLLKRAVDKIVAENNRRWMMVNSDAKASYRPDLCLK